MAGTAACSGRSRRRSKEGILANRSNCSSSPSRRSANTTPTCCASSRRRAMARVSESAWRSRTHSKAARRACIPSPTSPATRWCSMPTTRSQEWRCVFSVLSRRSARQRKRNSAAGRRSIAAIHEHRRAAKKAGLRYVTDGISGIRRRRVGGGWAYYAPGGSRITDDQVRKRLNSLAIPPAWTDVWICPDPDGHIQATARDARGRKQYRYHPSYRDARDQSKFRRMLEFSEVLPILRERIERDLSAADLSRKQLLATVLMLL